MKLIFAGTPPFAAASLAALIAAGHEISLVLTQPDRPAGRGMQPKMSAVKELALAHRLPLFQPERLKNDEHVKRLTEVAADAMVVAAYGLILPQAVLDLPAHGCINVHASLLPRWRGAAPIQRAIEAGDAQTGISIMQMDAGLDTGAVLERRAIAIASDDTAATLEEKLAALGAEALVSVLGKLGTIAARPQDAAGATYAAKIAKAEAAIDWRLPAAVLERQIRAFNPYPGASSLFGQMPLKIWRAELETEFRSREPGRVLAVDASGIVVACGDAALRLTEIQRAGAARLPAKQFLSGVPLRAGDLLG